MKNKLTLLNTILLTTIIAVGAFYLTQKKETVYIDVGILMQKYDGMLAIRNQIEEERKGIMAQADSVVAEWEHELKAYEKERHSLTAKETKAKEELLKHKQLQISKYHEMLQQKAAGLEDELAAPVLDDIDNFISEYGKKKGYRFILGANSTGNIIYANERADITDEILSLLNERYKTLQAK